MKPLPTSQQVMTWLCMCPADESISRKQRLCYAAFTLIMGMSCFAGLIASIVVPIKYLSTDFERSLYAVLQVATLAGTLNFVIVGLFNRRHIAAIFTELSKLYTANESETSFRFLVQANDKSEWLWKVYFKFGIIGLLVNGFVSTVASVAYCFYKYGSFHVEHLYRPHKLVLPWNQDTLNGYIGLVCFSFFNGECYMIINGAFLILFTSICWHHQAFYERFRNTALKLDQPVKRNANEILCKLIRFHISVKNWFLTSADVYSPFVLVQLICNVIFMATDVFELDLRVKHTDLEFFLLLFSFPIGITNLYVYCYFGKLATESYEKMTECLYELNWHELSLDLQKKTLLMIQNMQRPIYYHGFSVAILNLRTFVKFVRAIFTYYMMFKTLTTK